MTQSYDLGPEIITPHGVDRSLLAHCLQIADPDGWAIEFGVGKGASLKMIAQSHRVLGFGSTEGLPEAWRPNFPKGAFTHPTPTGIVGATVVPGWFEDTVPNYDWPDRIALVHIDCDLYSSTTTVLASIGPFIHAGTVVCFDEFHGFTDDLSGEMPGEQRAWREYLERDPLTWEPIGHGREQYALLVTGRA